MYKDKSILVAVSKEIQNIIFENYGLNNVKQIYNPVDLNVISKFSNENTRVDDKFILWYGRIEENVKNLTLLLNAYKKSVLLNKNIKLYIIGEGNDFNLKKKT